MIESMTVEQSPEPLVQAASQLVLYIWFWHK